jgi:hypothetical protein
VVVLPAGTRPHLNDVSPGVKAVVMAVRGGGGGGATAGATTADTAVVSSGHRRSLEVVARHTKGRRSAPEKRRSSPGRQRSRGRVGRGQQTPRVWE